MFFVKAKTPQRKHFMFITPRGNLNRLRVHAAIFSSLEAAEKTVALNAPSYPDWQFKVVSA